MFIDTHSHLYLGELQNHIPEAIRHLREGNFSHSIQIGTSIETSQTCISLAKEYDIIRATVGIHPCEAQDIPIEEIPEQMRILESLIQKEKTHIVGVGEIGFDHYHLSSDTNEATLQKWRQIEWFRAQVELAKKYNLPVVIHTRNCSSLTLEELWISKLETFVIHCFSEEWSFATKVFDMGDKTKISFTGILTYPKSVTIQEVAKKSPLESTHDRNRCPLPHTWMTQRHNPLLWTSTFALRISKTLWNKTRKRRTHRTKALGFFSCFF
jgi:TatD DNase family protein